MLLNRTIKYFAIVPLAFFCLPYFANADTVDSLTELQAELQRAEYQQKIETAKNPQKGPALVGGVPSAKNIGSIVLDDFIPVAVYGMGESLRGDMLHRGAIFPISKGSKLTQGWVVSDFTSHMVTIKRGKESRDIPISASTYVNAMPSNGVASVPALPSAGMFGR